MALPTPPTRWNIPYQRNPFFTGREEVLSRLHRALNAEHAVALSQPQGITGLGGIGKTQTVLEYAYRYGSEYGAVFWVRADSITSLTSSMIELARILELPERNEQDQEIIVQAVLRWFRLHSDWLLIYDNIDDLSIAERFLPKAGAGHLLFTTRAHALGGLAERLEIGQMDPDIGALLLLRRASLLALQATLNMANPDEQRLARTISQELDGLPLALDQAGAYIKETPCPLPEYLPRYQSRRSDLLRERGRFDQDYPASVATTWSLSFEKVSQADPAAPELLQFCAFLAPDAIPEELLTAGADHLGDVLAPVVLDPLHFDRVCKEVLRFSLLQRGADERTLSVHRLVQSVLRDSMTAETQQHWMQCAVPAVNAALPSVEFATWPTYERLVPHALTCATWIEQVPLTTSEASHLLTQTGVYLEMRAQYGRALPLLKRALTIREQVLGLGHADTAESLNNLAELYYTQGQYEEAQPLFEQALAIREQTLEPAHPAVADSLNNLAELYRAQGQYVEAQPFYERALAILEQTLGPTHPNVAQSLNNLAGLNYTQGQYTEAQRLFERALTIKEQALGPTHPDLATSLNNLAVLYDDLGKYAEAEPLYKRALAIKEQALGPIHPDVATSLNNLAALYRAQGRYTEAQPLYERALVIFEQALGSTHPTVAVSLNNLAMLYSDQGKYAEAQPLYKRALSIREQQLGPDHPDVATSLNSLASLYRAQGKYAEAQPLYERALSIREQQLGPDHPDVAQSLNSLGTLYKEQERYIEAQSLYERSLMISEQALGPTHPNVAFSLNSLATLYRTQGRYTEAHPLYERALAIREQQLGPTHPYVAISLDSLAELYRVEERYEEAQQLYERALAIRERALGLDHPDVAESLNYLAELARTQEKNEEACTLFERALSIREQQLGVSHSQTQITRRSYISVLRVLGRDKEAKELDARLQSTDESKSKTSSRKRGRGLWNTLILQPYSKISAIKFRRQVQ